MFAEREFLALPYPLPADASAELMRLGRIAVNARSDLFARVAQTPEGQKLADFEASLRESIGVVHRRPWIGRSAS